MKREEKKKKVTEVDRRVEDMVITGEGRTELGGRDGLLLPLPGFLRSFKAMRLKTPILCILLDHQVRSGPPRPNYSDSFTFKLGLDFRNRVIQKYLYLTLFFPSPLILLIIIIITVMDLIVFLTTLFR